MNLSHEHFSASEINSYAQGVFNQVGNLIMLLSFVEFLYECKICKKKKIENKNKNQQVRGQVLTSHFYDVKSWSGFDVISFMTSRNRELLTSQIFMTSKT